jgi:hypothetical protein
MNLVSNNTMDDLFSFTLCHSDWEIVIASLYEAAGDRMSRADVIGLDSVYGSTLYDDGQKTRAIAQYLENLLPEYDD